MKIKYDRLTKEEKKQVKIDYINASDNNKYVSKKFKNAKIALIIGFVYGFLLFFFDLLKELKIFDYGFSIFNSKMILNYIYDVGIILLCLVLILLINKKEKEILNRFLINKKK